MYTYIYYFILNEEQCKKYIIDNITDSGKHIRANIGEGIKPYDVNIINRLGDKHILYRIYFTSDIYIPNLRNVQITKTFYSLQRDLHGSEYREDIELNKDLEFMKRKLFEIKVKEDSNKVTNKYTYYFVLNEDDIEKYVFSGLYDDYFINFGKDIYLHSIECVEAKENLFKIYKITFSSNEKILYFEKCDQIIKTIYSKETGSNYKSVYVRNIALNKNLEYVRRKMLDMLCKDNNKETETMNNCAYVSAGCIPNKNIGLEIKEVKYNGPATIVFWNDGTKTVTKCQDDMSNYTAEKGLAMAISKKVMKSEYYAIKDIKIGHNDSSIIIYWEHGTEAEIKFDNHMCDVEYCIALARVKKFFGSKTRNNTKWYEKFKSYLPKEEKKPLVVHLGKPNHSYENLTKKPDITCEDTHKETEQEFVLRLFNEGYSLKKISDKTGVTMYHVRRYIDEATKPDKFKNKETKKSSSKKIRSYHKLKDLEDPSWLLPEECKDVREAVKEKFKDKHITMSVLQKEYIRECKKYKLKQCYGNGYSMYELAKIIGDTNAAGLMRIWNDMNKEGV